MDEIIPTTDIEEPLLRNRGPSAPHPDSLRFTPLGRLYAHLKER